MNGSESNFSFHHVPLFWIQQTTYVNFAKEWPLKWRKIELEQIFYCDEGITWPKIFLQNNCGSNKHLARARARFTWTRLLSVQFNYSLIRMWKERKNDFQKNVLTYKTGKINAKIPRLKLTKVMDETRNTIGKVYFDAKQDTHCKRNVKHDI